MGSPYVQLLNQINCFEAANLTDPQKGKKTKTKSYQEMFCKLAFLKYPQNSQNAETTGLESLYNNEPGLQAVNFIEWTPAQVFSSEFFRIFKSTSE